MFVKANKGVRTRSIKYPPEIELRLRYVRGPDLSGRLTVPIRTIVFSALYLEIGWSTIAGRVFHNDQCK
jgi:hypothetical protein